MGKTLSKLFVDSANSTLLQFFRNALVGSFAFVLELGLMYLLTDCAHVYYLWSSVFSSLCAGGINYLLSTIWVFNQSKVKNKPLEFILFTAIGALGLLLNVFFLVDSYRLHRALLHVLQSDCHDFGVHADFLYS